MSRAHVDHRDLVRFAEERVNLPKEKADEFRAQARRLREKLDAGTEETAVQNLRKGIETAYVPYREPARIGTHLGLMTWFGL